MNSLETLTAQVQRYAALTERPEADFSSISCALAELNAPVKQTGTDLFIVSSFLLPCGCLTLI